ncbi:protein YgfX [Legionella hackeliae]|uniref:protein YgfX n=1 Tax=Legionella hackeliae TaxID=449 RepID=UPI00351A9D38
MRKSQYFLRIVLLVYSCAFLIVYNCFWPLYLKLLTEILLSIQLLRILRDPRPYSQYSQLTYANNRWSLHKEGYSTPLVYQRMRIIIDPGLFLLMELKNEKRSQLLIIFSDQTEPLIYKTLKLHEKIVRN